MDEMSKTSSQPLDSRRLIGLIVVGLLLAEAILVVIVALTRDVLLPALAQAMGDTTSPLSLGKQDFNFPDLLTAVLQLCLAAIVAIVLNSWINKKPKASKTKSLSLRQPMSQAASISKSPVAASRTPAAAGQVSPSPESTPVVAVSAHVAPAAAQQSATAPAPQATSVARAQFTPLTSSQPTAPVTPLVKTEAQSAPAQAATKAQPAKPKKPKEVYYNIVGERISPADDDEET